MIGVVPPDTFVLEIYICKYVLRHRYKMYFLTVGRGQKSLKTLAQKTLVHFIFFQLLLPY